ncbi:MAG: hypothetical protein AAFP69_08060 [Planctomycetota bacterium]
MTKTLTSKYAAYAFSATMAMFFLTTLTSDAVAHHPQPHRVPRHSRIEVIPPLRNPHGSYRRRYNRPTNLGGKIAYIVAPTSQEAMAWHAAQHQGLYRGGVHHPLPAHVPQYRYPKPWQVLQTGPRYPVKKATGK